MRITRLISPILLVAVIVGFGATMPSADASLLLQDTPIPVLANDELSGKVTQALVSAYNTEHAGAYVFEQENGASADSLCANEIGIFATTAPLDSNTLADCPGVVEVMVALDGAVVVAAEGVDFMECLTRDQLELVFGADGTANAVRWNQVSEDFPERTVSVYVPDTARPIIDFFNSQVLGDVGTRSGTLNLGTTILRNLNSRQSSIGYVPLSLYLSDPRSFKSIALDSGNGCIVPTSREVAEQHYLAATPIYWYVASNTSFPLATLVDFLTMIYSEAGQQIIMEANAWPIPDNMQALSLDNVQHNIGGNAISSLGGDEPPLAVRLTWSTGHDLDLGLRLPDNSEIGFFQKAANGFVRYADDGNEYCNQVAEQPYERIIAVTPTLESALYIAFVQQSFNCLAQEEEASFTLEFIVDGEVQKTVNGTINPGPDTFAEAFEFPG